MSKLMTEYKVIEDNSAQLTLQFREMTQGAINWEFRKTGRKIECPLCEHSYANVKALVQHFEKVHEDCPHCNLSFVGLPSHLRSHNVSASENSLNTECKRFVERLKKRGYTNYEIDRALGVAFGVAT